MPKWTPSQKQFDFVEGLIAGKSISEAAEEAGCSRFSYHKRWSKDANFLSYLHERRLQAAGAKLPKIDKAIFSAAEQGDIAAARLVYEVFGNLKTPAVQVNTYAAPEGEGAGEKVLSMLDALQERKVRLHAVGGSAAQPTT